MKLHREAVRNIRRQLSQGSSCVELAIAYGVHPSTISDIWNRVTWRDGSRKEKRVKVYRSHGELIPREVVTFIRIHYAPGGSLSRPKDKMGIVGLADRFRLGRSMVQNILKGARK